MVRWIRLAFVLSLAVAFTGYASSAIGQSTKSKPTSAPKAKQMETASVEPDGAHWLQKRRGTTPEGLPYSITDGDSGSVGSYDTAGPKWFISCQKDEMTDERACGMGSLRVPLIVLFMEDSPISACITKHKRHDRKAAIRIDGGKPIDTDERGCVKGPIITQLAKGKKVVFRYFDWTSEYGTTVTTTDEMTGLASAIELGRFLLKEGERLTY